MRRVAGIVGQEAGGAGEEWAGGRLSFVCAL
jgi:hypothetical protein